MEDNILFRVCVCEVLFYLAAPHYWAGGGDNAQKNGMPFRAVKQEEEDDAVG